MSLEMMKLSQSGLNITDMKKDKLLIDDAIEIDEATFRKLKRVIKKDKSIPQAEKDLFYKVHLLPNHLSIMSGIKALVVMH